jgi:predicted RNA-binding Zn-ribbon protein involved in translation (DUF1610 family)
MALAARLPVGGESVKAHHWVWMAIGAALFLGGPTWLMLASGTRGAEIANVAAFPMSGIGIIIGIIALVGGRKSAKAATTTSEGDTPPGRGIRRPVICLLCGKSGSMRLHTNYASGFNCPRCGAANVAQLHDNGQVSLVNKDYTASYQVRPHWSRLGYIISNVKSSSPVLREE